MAFKSFFEKKTKRSTAKYIYFFDEGSGKDQGLLGYKGASLCELKRLGLNVPPGFILSSELCKFFYREDVPQLPFNLIDECSDAVHELERQTGRKFDASQYIASDATSLEAPLLLSVRCAASLEIPGLTSTVLNLGMNAEIVKILARDSRNLRWAYDSYRRFLQMFGTIVLNVDEQLYENILEDARKRRGVTSNTMLNASDLMYVVEQFKCLADVPEDPWLQLTVTINTMLKSWISRKAERFRDLHNIPFDLGNAIVVQSMVFGNLNLRSGVGSVTSRNPITGDKELFGFCTKIALGDSNDTDSDIRKSLEDLSIEQPDLHRELQMAAKKLETHFRDVQTVEFCIEDGVLYILETRKAERTAQAALRIATALVNERVLSEREAIISIDSNLITRFVFPMLDPRFESSEDFRSSLIGQAQAGLGGVVTGMVLFNGSDILSEGKKGPTIFCKPYFDKSDEQAIKIANGLLVGKERPCDYEIEQARQNKKTLIMGIGDSNIKLVSREELAEEPNLIREGSIISMDGSTGNIFCGTVPTINPIANRDFQSVMHWAEKYKNCLVKCVASGCEDVDNAMGLGAEGVGLFSTDELIKGKDCLGQFHRLLFSETSGDQIRAGSALENVLQQKFYDLYMLVQSRKVVTRLFNGPLSSMLPNPSSVSFNDEVKEISLSIGISVESIATVCSQFQEVNPLIGCRGCRLEILKQEITRIQARAITGAVLAAKHNGLNVIPYIAVPWICGVEEMEYICQVMQRASQELLEEAAIITELKFGYGALIEVPRACLQAENIAKCRYTDFLWFNTDSLTEMTLGMSISDQHKYMSLYHKKGILAKNPFYCIDKESVGKLLRVAVEKCKECKPSVKLGVFGQHSGDRESVDFFVQCGIDILICTNTNHIPAAKLLAAQSVIKAIPGSQVRVQESIDPYVL